ncbi:Ubiquitin-like domain-containing CTD phosphatase [Chlorella sorokiniana]|uniref:protein-serine/threonine phosphatase n=1 Tax=Chlorella sorokiniana TaxID=3076 RepID=A0A2P6TTY6_CHLSO|nr:Ubiquitin-like domain-containing CTD phosphatase [Chlorella sorokiniana]|eukprot:PRW57513.1 Ubiquitin-like domain-containing CTD phosphatase [Chlorella sorokiniana]
MTEDAGGAADAATAAPTASAADTVELAVKWQKQDITIHVEPSESVQGIKRKLEAATSVSEKRMKLLGLKVRSGKPAADADVVADLMLKPGSKIMMMGTAEADIERLNKDAEVAPHVQDDFDIQEEGMAEMAELKDRPEVQEKLARRITSCNVKVLNPPRPGKKLLVADIDYTIFDLNSSAERPEELARPFLHEFFSAIYADYDIVIWSATSMKWVEVKMRELGVSTHPDYKLSFMLDHLAMITVQHPKYGLFDCKPLQFIWSKFPENYGPHNTIMLDDLRRNYVLNKQNGLVIRPFKKAHLTRTTDRELLYLSAYLTKIAALDSLEGLNHKHWESYAKAEIRQLCKQLEAQQAQQQAERQPGGSGAGGS